MRVPYSWVRATYPWGVAGRGPSTSGVGHEDPGLTPARTRTRAREACALAYLPSSPNPAPRTGPMMIRVAMWGGSGPAAPAVTRPATGRCRALTSPEIRTATCTFLGPPPVARAFRGLPDRWAPGPVVA